MKNQRRLQLFTILLFGGIFLSYCLVIKSQIKKSAAEDLEFCARVLSNQLWNMDRQSSSEYIALIQTADIFKAITIYHDNGDKFISSEPHKNINGLSSIPSYLGLTKDVELHHPLYYRGEMIGKLDATWTNRTGLMYLLGGLLLALFAAIVMGYGRQVMQQRKLDAQKELKREIKERIKVQEELLSAKREAENANLIKSEFLANMSHEIRTPLHVILGYTEILESNLKKRELDGNFGLYFEYIQRAGQRLLDTIQKIIDISRFHISDFPFQVGNVALKPLIDSTIGELSLLAERKGLALQMQEIPADLVVRGDSYALQQSIVNVVENAIKYTNNGSVDLHVEIEKERCVVSVSDTGVGISQEYLPHIFDEFSQETTGYDRPFEGTGLGLSLSRKFVEAGGGSISISSRKNHGTTVFIELPLGDAAATVVTKNDKTADRQNKEMVPDFDKHILIVEDDPCTQEFLRTALSHLFGLAFAENADEAMMILNNQKVSLILMDVSLKGHMDGLDLTSSIRSSRDFSTIPIIALTAHALERDRDLALEAGCTDYLSKPFPLDSLLSLIYDHCP